MIGVSVVVSTYGSIPYVHLQLEGLRRLVPTGTRVLVHDDSSEVRVNLQSLCDEYAAEFVSTPWRLGQYPGDVHAFWYGLQWCQTQYLVKLSRRFQFTKEWFSSLNYTLSRGYPTYGMPDDAFGWRLRTEAIALRVDYWITQLPVLRMYIDRQIPLRHVEDFMADIAVTHYPWWAIGRSRYFNNGNFLWYNFATADDYSRLAQEWGLGYTPEDFRNVDGAGTQTV